MSISEREDRAARSRSGSASARSTMPSLRGADASAEGTVAPSIADDLRAKSQRFRRAGVTDSRSYARRPAPPGLGSDLGQTDLVGQVNAALALLAERPIAVEPRSVPQTSGLGLDHVEIGGLSVACITEAETVEAITQELRAGRGGWVLTPNTDQLRGIARDPEVQELIGDVTLAVADGMPLVWASRLVGTPLPERVAGSNLIWSLTEKAAETGCSVFLLGGDPGVAERAADEFRRRWPAVDVAGTYCPPFGFEKSATEMQHMRDVLAEAKPDIVFVGLGFPKQERLIADLRADLPDAWFLGIGISLSFVSGDVDRAPGWMHDRGLEWLHRMITEPGRLFRRYVLEDIPFLLPLLVRAAVTGRHSRRAASRRAGAPTATKHHAPAG